MVVAVTMPKLGETVVEGTVARWLKQPGEPVARLEPLLEIRTDKIDTEVPAPAAGTLLRITVADGQTVAAGTVLGYLGQPGEPLPDLPRADAATAPAAAQSVPAQITDAQTAKGGLPSRPVGRAFVSPVVARMVAEHGLDLARIPGSGLHGRVTKKDVLTYLAAPPAPLSTPTPAPSPHAAPHAAPDDEFLEPLSAMRRIIATHMVRSKQTSPHVTTVFEADMTAVVRHRETHKEAYAQRGVRLTFTPYFVAAAAQALRAVPVMNARFHDDGERSALAYRRRVHIGVAVALEQGLVVPVIRDADERTLVGLARAVNELAEQARAGRLAPDATQGGTFTITNHGVSGSLLGTPILNQPQTGILGVGAIVKRAVVRSAGASLLPSADDAIVIRPLCFLSLTFDHRVLDGAQADAFMAHVVRSLETWPDAP